MTMPTTVRLEESVAASFTKKKGNRWLVVVAAPGQGMSGTYSRAVLKEQGPLAIPAGTKSFIGHKMPQDRDARDQWGKFPDGAYYDDNYDPEKFPEGALVAELEVFTRFKDMAEEIQDGAELSIFMDGEKDHEGNVLTMIPARWNSVDLVAFGGIEGAGLKEKLYESFHIDPDVNQTDSETSGQKRKEGKMDPDLKAAFDALNSRLDAIDTFIAAQTAPVDKEALQAEVNEEAVGKAVDEALEAFESQVALIDAEKELLPSQVESLRAEARKGKDVTPLIETAKKLVTEFKTVAGVSGSIDTVRITESLSSGSDDDFTVSRWKK